MTERCNGHASLADELRQYADGALDALEPLVERIRDLPPGPEPEPASCMSCPVCALITVLRGGRSELAVRLADQFAELLSALRTALEEGAGPARGSGSGSGGRSSRNTETGGDPRWPGAATDRPETAARRARVQRIPVRRDSWRTHPAERLPESC
ncbi:MAG TPA: hypothetical protein VFE65_25830 [Pseudonocardia sp.]|nr:hypothetical protein [Pseudonocardia sp.]